MKTVHDWKAKRSGATITVDGRTEAGHRRKVSRVVLIHKDIRGTIAITVDGTEYKLV